MILLLQKQEKNYFKSQVVEASFLFPGEDEYAQLDNRDQL